MVKDNVQVESTPIPNILGVCCLLARTVRHMNTTAWINAYSRYCRGTYANVLADISCQRWVGQTTIPVYYKFD